MTAELAGSTNPEAPVRWGPDRMEDLSLLCELALPGEQLCVDDLDSVCFAPDLEDPSGPFGSTIVLGEPSGHGAVVAAVRQPHGATEPVGLVQLLVVHPARRRRGIARRLMEAAEEWAARQGASTMRVGAAAPVYLFTGVDTRWVDALCAFEALGYSRTSIELDLVCSTEQPRRRTVPTLQVTRVGEDEDLGDLIDWAEASWPAWAPEFARAGRAGTAVAARSGDGDILGAAAHSVGRLGVIGPVAVDPGSHGGGIGTALMAAVLEDLAVAGYRRAEIAWVSSVRFYARSIGAKVGRASQVFRREIGERRRKLASRS